MRLRTNELISTLGPLRPSKIIDLKTGQVVSQEDLTEQLGSLIEYVHTWAVKQLAENLDDINNKVRSLEKVPSAPAELARQIDYQIDPSDLPREVLAKSRVNKLAGYLLIQAYTSWAESEVRTKQAPKPGRVINLGAIDKQMASLTTTRTQLKLRVKIWAREHEIDFHIPEYVQGRKITKWALPMIRFNQEKDIYEFFFPMIEEVKIKTSGAIAGVDLGRIRPYQTVVLNENRNVKAEYQTSGNSKILAPKIKNCQTTLKEYYQRRDRLEGHSLQTEDINNEIRLLKNKVRRLKESLAWQQAACLVSQLDKSGVRELRLENLKWVTGKHYGSRWDHSQQARAIEHKARRSGIKVRRVNPARTSQVCSHCQGALVRKNTREQHCRDCKKTLDRDYNAAINIAKDINKKHTKELPGTKRPREEQERVSNKESLITNSLVRDNPKVNQRSEPVRLTELTMTQVHAT